MAHTVLNEPVREQRPSDAQLVARLRGGELSAFRPLYDRHAPELVMLLRRLLRPDEVPDASQEAIVRLHRGLLEGYDPGRPLRPYALRVARNVAIEFVRRREKHGHVKSLGIEPVAAAAAPQAFAEAGERGALIQRALGTLSPEHRAAVVLRYAHGLTQLEIAEALACSERTVRNRLRAAATLLERELRRLGLGAGEETR